MAQSTLAHDYAPVDPTASIAEMIFNFRCHAVLTWLCLPFFAVAQWLVVALRPTCDRGYSNYSLVILALVIAHHLVAESRAWAAAKALLARPELTVMRHFGVLRQRRKLVLFGILEDLDMFTDLSFPFTAYACDNDLTEHWLQSWELVPLVGKQAVKVLERLRFWGFSALLMAAVCFAGLSGISQLTLRDVMLGQHGAIASGEPPRLSGEIFYKLARCADTAVMPSVAALCEEMADQRRWVFDAKEDQGGALAAIEARRNLAFGKGTVQMIEQHELQDQAERDRVDAAGEAYVLILLVSKILLGNAAQLWLQASFFELSFDYIGNQACFKLLAGMAISGLQVLVRCSGTARRMGCWGYIFTAVNFFLLAWAAAKVIFAYRCAEHVWNLTTGCVDIM